MRQVFAREKTAIKLGENNKRTKPAILTKCNCVKEGA